MFETKVYRLHNIDLKLEKKPFATSQDSFTTLKAIDSIKSAKFFGCSYQYLRVQVVELQSTTN